MGNGRESLRRETPKTLKDAIRNGISCTPASMIVNRTHLYVRDFLAQRFGVAMLNEESDIEREKLKRLFDLIVND